jgi:hypothetical protein
LECWEWDQDQVQHFSWVTDLRVNKGTVYQLMRGNCSRATGFSQLVHDAVR